ncbi:MAG: HDIG domain-containing protein, partial [Selenomonadales bacterium]|nr:HDIG domain-containing protein [Selenomonadales bacterium]
PGTHHHGLVVANLAEAAANEVGADPILVRIGSYYHDVGKLYRPAFFVENQFGGENPHDQIAPSLSTRIITAHVRDGISLCREYHIPQPIIDIVAQHHGTMSVAYFYHKAKEAAQGEEVNEDDFRYDGPKPQSKEAALVMLADSCEAAVRSLGRPDSVRIETMVRKIIAARLQEGQLDECNLTLRDLSTIGDVFIRLLSSMFHTRIEYPESKELEGDYHADRIKQSTRKTGGNAGNRR